MGNPVSAAIMKKAHETLDSANKFRGSAHAQAGDYSHPHAARKAESGETEHAAPAAQAGGSDLGQELAEKAKNVNNYVKATQ